MSAFLTNTGGASFNRDQGGAGRDYKRAQSDYGRAMRLLRRSNDPNDALKMIGLRDQGREAGIEIGGIRSSEDTARNATAFSQNMERMAADREREAQMNQGMGDRVGALEAAMEPQGAGMVKKDISGRVIAPMRKPETGNIGTKVLDSPLEPKRRLSLAEQARVGSEESTRSGAFGKLSQGRR